MAEFDFRKNGVFKEIKKIGWLCNYTFLTKREIFEKFWVSLISSFIPFPTISIESLLLITGQR